MENTPKQTANILPADSKPSSGWQRFTYSLRRKWGRFKSWYIKHKKLTIPATVAIVLALVGLGVYFFLQNQIVDRNLKTAALAEEKPATKISPLTGLEVAADKADRPVTAIMIENSPDARPQSSLIDAGVVFEAVTEGGITRFMALYQEQEPERIGPVRSIRVPFVDWYMGFDAALAHVGGAPQALALIRQRGARDLDQFAGGQYYYRSSDRFAPHNMYTSMGRLDAYKKSRGYTSSDYTPYERKEESPAETPQNNSVTINYSSGLYNVQYKYRPQTNDYTRLMGGAAHKDHENGKQITTKNIALIRMPTTYSGGYAVMDTIGSGTATVFRDGVAVEGRWRKNSPKGQLQLINKDGTPIELVPGNTWFAILPSQGSASY